MFNDKKLIKEVEKSLEILSNDVNLLKQNNDFSKDGFVERKKIGYSDSEKRKAACALNLCMVSVSQIIDYNDIYILEQEYNAILNNLNLHEMPKDEALLSILKQLLDTISFFRIQEGDKKFIEKDYQQKVKDAVWNAVPNLSVIVPGHPLQMAIQLATQVGIGYMNYRKEKAKITNEKDKQYWSLQRSAMEQFNGLRRELFDTAWRLADKYEFPDEWRLTENQITQYNKILMDTDLLRKYHRLEVFQGNFEAYPDFWYFFANTANLLSNRYFNEGKSSLAEEYLDKARQYYQKFNESHINLLREDIVAAACQLEYVDTCLMNKENRNDDAKDKIKECLKKAYKYSKKDLDVIQNIAFQYMRIDDYEEAKKLLKILVNEEYNIILNAQLLSRLYVCMDNKENRNSWEELASRYNGALEDYLISFGENDSNFLNKQKNILIDQTDYLINKYFDKYEIKYNKCIPVINNERRYDDFYFSGDNTAENARHNEYKRLFQNESLMENYFEELKQSDFKYKWVDVLNEMIDGFDFISEAKIDDANESLFQILSEPLITYFANNSDKLNKLIERIETKQIKIDDWDLFSLFSFKNVTCRVMLQEYLRERVMEIRDIGKIVSYETMLKKFASKENLPEPENNIMFHDTEKQNSVKKINFESIFGEEGKQFIKKIKCKERAKKEIISRMSKILNKNQKGRQRDSVFIVEKDAINKYWQGKKNYIDTKSDDILAVFKDKNLFGHDFILAYNYIEIIKTRTKVSYSEVKYEDALLHIGSSYTLDKDSINSAEFNNLCVSLSNIEKSM